MADDLDDDGFFLQPEIEEESNDQVEEENIEIKEEKKKKKKEKSKSIQRRPVGTYSDLIHTFRVFYKKSKSEYELDELLSKFTPNLGASPPSNPTMTFDQYLDELVSAKQWSKGNDLPSAPVLMIIAQSALRCIELGKILKNSSSSKFFTFHYLFAKHKKLSEQIEYLQQGKSSFNIVIGTPKRLDDILQSKSMNLKRLKFVVIDWNYENLKQQRLIDLNQLKSELCLLLCEKKLLSKRFSKEKTRIAVF